MWRQPARAGGGVLFSHRIRLFGIDVRLDASRLLLAALAVWTLADGGFPEPAFGLGLPDLLSTNLELDGAGIRRSSRADATAGRGRPARWRWPAGSQPGAR